MVAARRLRKSMLKEMPNIDLENINSINNTNIKHKNNLNEDRILKNNLEGLSSTSENKEHINFKLKIIIKIFLSITIIFVCLIVKLFFKEQAISNKFVKIIICEYNKDYSKNACIEKSEDIINSLYQKTKYIVPERLANSIKEKYIVKVKPYIVNFEVKKAIKKLFIKEEKLSSNTGIEINQDENTGMGGAEPLDNLVQTLEVPAAQVMAMKDNVQKILSKKIDIKLPVKGTLTSKYGNREPIFEGVNSYHTGVDIANKMGTEIKSATYGIVKKVEQNNKYYGNFIEIETDGVIFKYGHLQKTNVNVGDEVTQESIIGLMGSTGMSTGPHLHFEIKIDGSSVDPNQIIKIY